MSRTTSTTTDSRQFAKRRPLTDVELLAREFDAADPESLAGVSREPVMEADPHVEFAYDMGGRGRKVRCVHCRYENHYRGVVVVYPSGRRELVGRDCAVTHHGVDMRAMLNDFDAHRERQEYLRRKRTVLDRAHDIFGQMEELLRSPSVTHFGAMKRDWRELMGSMWTGLTGAAHGDGVLRVERDVRDAAAERRREERLGHPTGPARKRMKARGELKPIWRCVVEDLGRLDGTPFFREEVAVLTSLESLDRELRGWLTRLYPDDLTTARMREAMMGLGAVRTSIAEQMKRLTAASQAFAPANLSLVAAWANGRANGERPELPQLQIGSDYRPPASRPRTTYGTFAAQGRRFTRSEDGRSWFVELPEWYAVPEPAILATLGQVLAVTPTHRPPKIGSASRDSAGRAVMAG